MTTNNPESYDYTIFYLMVGIVLFMGSLVFALRPTDKLPDSLTPEAIKQRAIKTTVNKDDIRHDLLKSACGLIKNSEKADSCLAAVAAGDYQNASIVEACNTATKLAGAESGRACHEVKNELYRLNAR